MRPDPIELASLTELALALRPTSGRPLCPTCPLFDGVPAEIEAVSPTRWRCIGVERIMRPGVHRCGGGTLDDLRELVRADPAAIARLGGGS